MSKANSVIAGAIVFVLAGGGLFFHLDQQKKEAAAAVSNWITTQPVNAIILRDHPKSQGYLQRHFAAAYDTKGQAGLEPAQARLLPIFNEFFLVDYAWYIEDKALRNYLRKEYNFLMTLHDKTKPPAVAAGAKKKSKKKKAPPVCDQYVNNPTKDQAARKAVGDKIYDDYLKASEDLMLSASDKKLYPFWPGAEGYDTALKMSTAAYMSKIATLFPTEAASIALTLAESDPEQGKRPDCQTLLYLTYALLQMDTPYMSLLWRSGAESSRPRILAERQKRKME